MTGFYKQGENTFDSEIVGRSTTNGFNGFANPPGSNVPAQSAPNTPFPGATATFFSGLNFNGVLNRAFRQSVNRDETEIYGFEFSADYDHENWFAQLNYGMLRGEDRQTGLNLNSITGDELALTLGIRPTQSTQLGVYGIWNGGRAGLVNDTNIATSAYDIYGAFASWQVNETLELRVGADNIFDTAYERTSTSLQEPGRNVFVQATLHW